MSRMSSEITTSDGESSKDRQENELISISAIFPNEVVDLRAEDVWKTWRPLELLITIVPEGSMTVHQEATVKVDLYVKCTEDYPNSVPRIDIRNVKGISNKDAAELRTSLINSATEHVGEEMILELINGTKAFLHGHTNKPQFQSFYEEMVFNQQKLLEDLAAQQKMEEEKKQRYGKIEQETLQKVLKERKAAVLKTMEQKDISILPTLQPDCLSKPKNDALFMKKRLHVASCDGTCNRTKKLTFKSDDNDFTMFYGPCLGHNERGCIVHTGFNSMTGELVVVVEWSLPLAAHNNPKTEHYRKIEKERIDRLTAIEQEVRTLTKLKNDSLVRYLGMTYLKEKNRIVVYLIQEFVQGSSLILFRGIPVTIQQLQVFCRGILLGLQFLHENSIVHKDLRDTNVFIDHNGCVRLLDYSIDKRLYDLSRMCTGEPELSMYPPSIGKGGKKCDIYRLGVLLLHLHLGVVPKNTVPIFPPSLNSSFKDFLQKCLVHDVQERWSAEQLLSHSFLLISSVPNAIPKGDKVEQEGKEDDDEILSLASNSEIPGGSRLKNEFDILKHLGSGGFGNVLKVRNKLDARIYALKCIPLNPSNKHLNRKIKREVKLLSRLNHENIVRYYNSWIETTVIPEFSSTDTSGTLEESSEISVRHEKESYEKSSIKSSVQWSDMQKDGSSSEDEDDDCDMFDVPFFFSDKSFDTKQKPSGDSSSIVFASETNHAAGESPTVNQSFSKAFAAEKLLQPRTKQFMYIQMEFCEKSTLRTAIDNKLHQDTSRVWRLFREIVEGLHHIHQQGMIHRDLKPANIFLDSCDRVKIGDFGLATTSVISNPICSGDVKIIEQFKESHSDVFLDGTQTGNVGTALYLAPELTSTSKCGYDQKVDLYSLGIIFFEMCYPPPVTAMERIKLIMNIRMPKIDLPKSECLSGDMKSILKWLLQHDPKKRPDSSELLASNYIPALLMEETELQELLQNTVSNPQSRIYKHMINALFNQEVRSEFEFTYDADIHKSQSIKNKQNQVFSNVVDTLNKVARKRGAVYFSVPMLMPKCTVYEKDNCVHVMDHGGGIVTLPRDLRVPFARHIARREVNLFKRFSLEKVYREHKVFGCHPREQYEYAFDIVTPTPCSFMPDAEVLAMVCEIIAEFPSLQHRNYYIRLNHVSLLKAIVKYCELKPEAEWLFYRILSDFKNKKSTKLQFHQQLSVLDISEETLGNLCRFIEVEDSMEKVRTLFQPLLKKKGQVAPLVQKSLKELHSILEWAELFGIKQNIVITPRLAHDVELFSGAIFQFVCEPKSKNKGLLDILAAGGRFDKLISSFKVRTVLDCDKEINHSAVGVSIAVERIVSAELNTDENQSCGVVDILVHSTGDSAMLKERISLLQRLWSLDVSATIIYDKTVSLDDAEQFCRDNRISHIFILKDSEPQHVKIRSMEKDKVSERRILYSEVEEYVPKLCTKSPNESCQRSRIGSISSSSSVSVNSSLRVKILPPDKSHNSRKREALIHGQVSPLVQAIPNRPWEVVAVDLTMYVLGSVALHCDIGTKAEDISSTFTTVIEKHQRHKKLLVELRDEICDIKTKRPNVVIVIFSLCENNFRVLL